MEPDKKKTFKIPVSNGIFEHYERIGDAIWLFLWCIDRTTKERTDDDGVRFGTILGGMPLRDGDIAESIPGSSAKLVRKWRLQLAQRGYLFQRRTSFGHALEVNKSKKWSEPSELPKRVIHPSGRIAQNDHVNCLKPSDELPETANTKKTLQDSTRRSSRRIAQTGNSGGEAMFDPDDHYFCPTGNRWKKLGIGKLSERYRPFVELANTIEPKLDEMIASWCGRVIDACRTADIEYTPEFYAITQRYRKHDEPCFSAEGQIREVRRRREQV